MNSYNSAVQWVNSLCFRAYAGTFLTAFAVLAAVVVGILPHGLMPAINAFLSGVVFVLALGVVAFGGNRVHVAYYGGAALVAAGLFTSIPSLFVEYSPVAWGAAISRLGLVIIAIRGCHDLYVKYQAEKAKEGHCEH